MLVLKILVLAVLLLVFIQDLKNRSVYWFLFPILLVLLFAINLLQHRSFTEVFQPIWVNCVFLALQFLLVSAYFSIKGRHWVNITSDLLGWGDILLLLTVSCYLSVLNFLFYYLASLIMTLVTWMIWQLVSAKKNKQIPLAGFQALIFSVFLTGDWCWLHLHVTDDTWLLNLMHL